MNSSLHIIESPLPPELLGRKREDVKLLVIDRGLGTAQGAGFEDVVGFIGSGDVLVFNNSRTVRASIPVYFPDIGEYGEIHVGTSRGNNRQLVEIRPKRLNEIIEPGSRANILGNEGRVKFFKRHSTFSRYFWAQSADGSDLLEIAGKIGKILRYGHIPFDIPESFYENDTGEIPGSVEYPSAARPFTGEVLDKLRAKGVIIRKITLHCNLGSLEPHEFNESGKLLDEQFTIPENTAASISEAKNSGRRVIAVGTSVVRALESAFKDDRVVPGDYSTELYIRGKFKFNVVDSMVTGMHEEQGSHIGMISSFAGKELLEKSYRKATEDDFAWHEFGDLALII